MLARASLLRRNLVLETRRCLNTWVAEFSPLFRRMEVKPDVWIIEEKYFDSWNKANIFFIKGSNKDLLIDSGIGIYNLAKYLSATGLRPDGRSKPLDVVLTHTHFDHSGGVHHFDDPLSKVPTIHVHKAEAPVLLDSNNKFKTAAWITDNEVAPKPYRGWNPRSYHVPPVTQVKEIDEGFSFDLGNFKLDVLHLAGHTVGSLGLVDHNNGLVVTGDVLYETDEQLIDWYVGGSNVGKMTKSVERLLRLLRENRHLETVLPGHNPVINNQSAIAQAESYIQSAKGYRRTTLKRFSRARTAAILALNTKYSLPNFTREWLKN